ncbi:MAG: hypothetical protein CK604_06185 [Curvibacter sp. PD_MW3]|nr:MAG: hypothetical protein CK604_06185 [Curvibacter sp. PD_MW3]
MSFMRLESLVKMLGKTTVEVAIMASPMERPGTDPRSERPKSKPEGLTLTATIQGWTPELVCNLVPNPPLLPGSFAGALNLAITKRGRSQLEAILGEGSLSFTTVRTPDDLDMPLDIVLRMEAAASWSTIETIEEHAIGYLAELFDGRARISLKQCRDGHTTNALLCVGNLAKEKPIFGTRKPLDLLIGADESLSSTKLSFNTSSETFTSILNAGPARMKSTPGGRRELAMLFLESEIETALAKQGQDETFEIEDFTPGPEKRMRIALRGDDANETSQRLAKELCERWPEIFA